MMDVLIMTWHCLSSNFLILAEGLMRTTEEKKIIISNVSPFAASPRYTITLNFVKS